MNPKMIPMKNRQYDPDQHCGCLIYFNGKQQPPCVRSLTCSTHSVITKRAVQGRSKEFDILLTDYQRRLKDRNDISGDSSSSSSSSSIEIKVSEKKIIIEQIAKKHSESDYLPENCRALSPYPENYQPITYADVLKMIIPPHTITSDGRRPIEVVSHSYRTVESDPYDPNDPYAEYRLTLPQSERFKPRIQVLIRTVDTIIDANEEYDLEHITQTFHDFRNISLLTETSYWRVEDDPEEEKEKEEITREELQTAIQEAVRTKYEKEIISENLTVEFGDQMTKYMGNEQNSKVIRKICKTNDMRKVTSIKKSLVGIMELSNADSDLRDSLDVPLASDAIFDFHIPDEFITDQLQEVEILPEDLAQDETLAELFGSIPPNEPITLESLLAIFREENIKKSQQGIKRSLNNDDKSSSDKNTTKRLKIQENSVPDAVVAPPPAPLALPAATPSTTKMINFEAATTIPMIIDDQIGDSFMSVDQADIDEIIENDLLDDGIEIPGVERNASPIDFLFDMHYQNSSLSDSECDDEENSGEFFFFFNF